MTTVRVYGTLADVVNHPLERARVTVALVATSGYPVELPAIETTIVSPLGQTVESAFSFDLAPQSECDPSDSVYTFKVSVPGVGVTKLQHFVIPDGVSEAWIGELYIDPPSSGGDGGGSGPTTLTSLVDVDLSSPADNQVLTYDSSTGQWRNEAAGGGGGPVLLGDLDDVSAYANAGDLLGHNGTEWANVPGTLDGALTDVDITSPADGQVLAYDSTAEQWQNQTPAGGGAAVAEVDTALPVPGAPIAFYEPNPAGASPWGSRAVSHRITPDAPLVVQAIDVYEYASQDNGVGPMRVGLAAEFDSDDGIDPTNVPWLTLDNSQPAYVEVDASTLVDETWNRYDLGATVTLSASVTYSLVIQNQQSGKNLGHASFNGTAGTTSSHLAMNSQAIYSTGGGYSNPVNNYFSAVRLFGAIVTPADGALLYTTDDDTLFVYSGGDWQPAASGGGGDLTWTAMTTDFTDPGQGGPFQYAKGPDNVVHLRGYRNGGGGNVSGVRDLFTLPVGFRPANEEWFSVYSEDGTGSVLGMLRIQADGDIQVLHGTGLARLSLSGVSFSAAP